MLGAAASFAILTALIRHVSAELHSFQIVFFRNVFGFAFVLAWLAGTGFGSLRTRRPGLHVVRALVSLVAMMSWFTAVVTIPVAEATALSFSAPLFATLGAALFLGERVGVRRWSATLVGFAGTMLVLRPGLAVVEPGAFLCLASAAAMGVVVLMIKSLAATDTGGAMVFYMGIVITPLSLVPALLVGTTPSVEALGWLALMGFCATAAHLMFAHACSLAEISALLPIDFSRLVFVSVLGYVVFAETPDVWTWTGGTVIFAATVYTIRREASLRIARPAP